MALSETAASPASRTNLDLTLPQGNNFAQLPSLLIHPAFPELLDHGGLGHTLLMGMGGWWEGEAEHSCGRRRLARVWSKARRWELGRNLPRLGPKTLLEPFPLQYYPEAEPGLGVGERTGMGVSTTITRHL